ncbi:hypothetical protein ACJX0J_028207, partial [Zea mays]
VRLNVKVHHHVANLQDSLIPLALICTGFYCFYNIFHHLGQMRLRKAKELQETSILFIYVIEINLAISFSESWKILKPCLMPSFHGFMIVIDISKFFVLFLLDSQVRLNVKVHHHVAFLHHLGQMRLRKAFSDELQETSILCIYVIEINLAISFSESWKIFKPCLMPSFHGFMIVIEISKFFVLFLL